MTKTTWNTSSSWLFSILCLSILVSFVNSASVIVKRDVDEYTDSLGEAFSDKMENFHDTCIKESSCIEILQHCDKSQHIVYGICTFHTWFWGLIAGLAVLVTSLLGCLLYCKLKK